MLEQFLKKKFYAIKKCSKFEVEKVVIWQYFSISDKHTYIHNWPLQPFSQDYGLASHTTHVVCVNYIRERRDLQFNVDSERQIFWETFSWQFYLLSRTFIRLKTCAYKRVRIQSVLFFFRRWKNHRKTLLLCNSSVRL